MKCVVSVLMLLVVSCHHLKTAAQDNNTNMTSMIMPSTTLMNMSSEILSMSIDVNFSDFSDSFSSFVMMTDESLTINMTEFSPTLEMDMTTTMTTSSFIMTITTVMPMPSPTTMATSSEVETTSIMPTTTVVTTGVATNPTATSDEKDSMSTELIIGIAAGGGAALVVILVIIICCCCCCYQKRHREESYNIGPTVTARYWDANHPNDVGPGHVTSGGSMRSRTSWRDSLRSFTRGSLRRSFSLRRSSKRAKDKQQPNEYIGLYSTPL